MATPKCTVFLLGPAKVSSRLFVSPELFTGQDMTRNERWSNEEEPKLNTVQI